MFSFLSLLANSALFFFFFFFNDTATTEIYTLSLHDALPIWASLLAWPLLGERPSWRQYLALALSIGGVALLVGIGSAAINLEQLPGVVMALVAAVLFGLGTVYIATIPMTVAYLAWFRALRLVPASLAATTILVSPMVGVLGSTLVLGETLGPRQIVALGMTLTGVAIAARG